MGNREYTEKLVFIALLVALSVVLGIVDNMMSGFVSAQGVRIGLANIIILTGLYYLKFRESLLLVILKSLLVGFVIGRGGLMFTIGFSGSMLSFIVMYSLLSIAKDKVSLVGVSVAGGIAHNIGQILVVCLYYNFGTIFYLTYLIPIGIGTGIFIGYVVSILRKYLDRGQVFKTITDKSEKINLEHFFNEE